MKCPNCQAENRKRAEFCGKCGQSLQVELTCTQCGHSNPVDNNFCDKCGHSLTEQAPATPKKKPKKPSAIEPTSFADGRYQVKKFLGEGGKKKVYLAHDTLLDRDVAFALIKTEKLDDSARKRITREAQASLTIFFTTVSPSTTWGSTKASPISSSPSWPAATSRD